MQFIMDNYIWFAVGGIVIIMAIIGYIADKTDFGRNTEEKKEKAPKVKKEKKSKKEKVVEEPQKIEVEGKGINELTQSMQEIPMEETTTSEDLYAPLESKEEVDSTLYEPLVPLSNEQIEEPVVENKVEESALDNIELPASDSIATDEENIELQPMTFSTIEEPIEEDNVEEVGETTTQTIEPLNEEPVQIPASEPQATEEEDIWKF